MLGWLKRFLFKPATYCWVFGMGDDLMSYKVTGHDITAEELNDEHEFVRDLCLKHGWTITSQPKEVKHGPGTDSD